MNPLEAFATEFRLRIRADECGDPIIPGRRGQSQLYFDEGETGQLCLMVVDGPVAQSGRWKALGGKLWLGDIGRHPKTGKKVQDVKIIGIPLENAKGAIRLARVRPKKQITEVQREALAKWGRPFSKKADGSADKPTSQDVKPGVEAWEGVGATQRPATRILT